MIPKVAGWKKDSVSELTKIFTSDGVVAVVDVSGVPASNMIDMRNTLRKRMSITMAKKSLMARHSNRATGHSARIRCRAPARPQ